MERSTKVFVTALAFCLSLGLSAMEPARAGLLKKDPEKKAARQAKKAAKKAQKRARKTEKAERQAVAGKGLPGCGVEFSRDLWKHFVRLAVHHGATQEKKLEPSQDLAALVRKVGNDSLTRALVQAGMCQKFRSMQLLHVNTPLRHPRRLAFARKDGKLVGTLGKTWIHPEPYELDAAILTFEKLGGKGKAEVTVTAHRPSGRHDRLWDFVVDGGTENDGKVWKKELTGCATPSSP